MALDNPRLWINSANEYLLSGVPWVTSSAVEADAIEAINFPKVTKDVTIKCNSGSLAFAFTENGFDSGNFFDLSVGESFTGELRVRKVFVKGTLASDFNVLAGLTRIDMSALLGADEITGSNGFEGVG